MEKDSSSFGALLSRYRAAVGLSQEELANRAGLSLRGVSDLERGARTRPHATTVHLLAEALCLSLDDRILLAEAARRAKGAPAPESSSSPAPGSFLGAPPQRPLVGREEEMARIRAALLAVTEGTGQLLLLVGELGVGKTRLAQEVTVQMREGESFPTQSARFVLGTGRCYQRNRQTPYVPLVEALSELHEAVPPRIRQAVEPRWDRLRRDVDAPVTNGAGGREAQRRLFTAVTDFITALTDSMPIGLVFDDLQWADDGTISLLQHLARKTHRKPLLLVATMRDTNLSEEHPLLAHTLQELARERLAERLIVRRLSAEETSRLAANLMDQESLADDIAAFLYRRTKGIPRFIEGMMQALGGRLELQGEIGAGAMGRVFAAHDMQTGRDVAAKLMLARGEVELETLLRFQHEAAVLAKLRHPGIVEIYDSFIDEHASCIIMERLAGQSLGRILHDGPLPLARAKYLARQVAEALAYAHNQGIVHRDIKPDNVMALDGDVVKVTDFGIARLLQPDTSLHTMATTGMRMGTPLYMAPEQIEGKTVDGRTDIYALGAMLYHMVTGRPPFEGSDALSVAVKHLQEEPVPPSQLNPAISADWDALILKAMAKDPKGRYASMQEMGQALAALTETTAAVTVPRHRPRWTRVAAGAMAAVVVALVALWLHPVGGSRPTPGGRQVDAYLHAMALGGRYSGVALVAQGGRVLLDRGYGLADRANQVSNTPSTRSLASGVDVNMELVAALRLEEQGRLQEAAPICRYLPQCPRWWRSLTVRSVLDGTSHLPSVASNNPDRTVGQGLRRCQSSYLDPLPAGASEYGTCTELTLGVLFERLSHRPWTSVMRREIWQPAGLRDTGRATNRLVPDARARGYGGSFPDGPANYAFSFPVYTRAADIYRYDQALFSGRLLRPDSLRRMLSPRDAVGGGDASIKHLHHAYGWLTGMAFGHRVYYTLDHFNGLSAANMVFPRDGTTVVLLSNDYQNDLSDILAHVAGLLFGAPIPDTPTPIPVQTAIAVNPLKAIRATIRVPGDPSIAITFLNFTPGALWGNLVDSGAVARIDTRHNRVSAPVTITRQAGVIDGSGPFGLATWHGRIWTTDTARRAIAEIDPATNLVVGEIPVGVPAADLSVAGDSLWVEGADDSIVRVDLRTRKVVARLRRVGGPYNIVATANGVWFTAHNTAQLVRIDPTSNRIVSRMRVGTDPQSLAVGAGSLWVANGFGHALTRIDIATGRVLSTVTLDAHGNRPEPYWGAFKTVVFAWGAIWAIARDNQALVRIDPETNRITSSLTLAMAPDSTQLTPTTLAAAGDSIWVGADPRYLFRIDPVAMR